MVSEEKLKPCSVCGSTNLEVVKSHYYDSGTKKYMSAVECQNCLLFLRIDEWNTRPIEDGLIAEVNRLNNVIDRTIVVWENRVAEKENEIYQLNAWIDELIEKGNYLEHVLRKAYEEINGHIFNDDWRKLISRIQKERE